MAVAMKSAATVAKTEQKQKKLPVSRRHKKRRNAKMVRTVVSLLGMVFLLGYVGLYAQVTLYSYRGDDLTRQIRQAEMQNQALKAEIQTLASPERLAAAASEAGMEPSTDVIYVIPPQQVKIAKAD